MVEKVCKVCNGKGWITNINPMFKMYKKECNNCDGSGYVLETTFIAEEASK